MRWLTGVAVAFAVHGVVAGALWSTDPPSFQHTARADDVEIDVRELPPPPPPEPIAPEPPKQMLDRPVVVRHRVAVTKPDPKPAPPPAEEAPPPPNQTPTPTPPAEPAPPTLGVSLDSVVAGDSTVAVPVGNTTMGGRPRDTSAGPPKPYAGGVPGGTSESGQFHPVPDSFIAAPPEVAYEHKPDYPEEARRLGIEGQVMVRIGIDEQGRVVEVRVIRRLGHGFDEAASKAMWRFRFRPARASDGRAVAVRWNYLYTFQLPR